MSEQMQARYERQLLQWQHSSNYWYSQFSLCQAERDALRERVAVLERVAEAAAEWQESRREYHEVMCNGRRETVKQYERYRDAELGLDKALEADR